jgi:hypothetical protein
MDLKNLSLYKYFFKGNFDAEQNEHQVEEFNVTIKKKNLIELLENTELQNGLLVHFDFQLNNEASNSWVLIITYLNNSKTEHKGIFMKKYNELYKIISTDLDIESIMKIELEVSVYYCDQNNSLGKICKLLKRKIVYTKENFSKNSNSIVLKIEI